MQEHIKILPKYMLFFPQGVNIQSKSSFKTKPNKKDWQKLSFPTPISWDTRIVRDPPSLIYPIYLNPPSSYSNKASQNRVLSNFLDPAIRPIASAKPYWLLLAIPQNFPSSKTFSTL